MSIIATLAILLALGSAAGAQEVAPPVRVVEVDSANYPTIEATVTAPMALSGQRLTAEDFQVFEGDQPRTVDVRPLDPTGLELAVVIDPAIQGDGFIKVQAALLEVPVHLLGPTMSIVSATATPTVVLPPTPDRDAASTTLRNLVPGPGPSNVEDGISVALDQFSTDASRHAIVVMTTGVDFDANRVDQVTKRAERDGVAVYVIGLGPYLSPDIEQVAHLTGGSAWSAEPLSIVPAVDQIVADLRAQYELVVRLDGEDPNTLVRLVVSSAGITARGSLPYSAPVTAAVAPGPLESQGSGDSSATLMWFVLGGAALGLLIVGLAPDRLRSEAPRRSRGGLGTGRRGAGRPGRRAGVRRPGARPACHPE
jgi:hypothetical protein